MSADLIAFLNARLDEDAETAKRAAGVPWVSATRMVHVDPKVIRDNKLAYGRMGFVASVEHAEDLAHIARHDPARVQADVDAKRRILDAYRLARKRTVADGRNYGRWADGIPERQYPILKQDGPGNKADIPGLELAIRLLALAHAGHPDYREEWRP